MRFLSLCVLILLVTYDVYLIQASRVLKVLPPPMPKLPSVHGVKFNHYKMYEKKAFRPTCPGPSPGVGHGEPPGSC